MKFTDNYTLSNGFAIPVMGFGTYLSPADGTARDSVVSALQNGYRMVDTARAYGNESDVGAGIKLSGIPRDQVFVSTKHWVTNRGYEKTLEAIDESLAALGTDYIDLYLIHWPCVAKTHANWKEMNAETWRGFERGYKDGKLRAIGLCNFERKHLDALLETCEIKPMLNQIEYHPGYIQQDTLDYSKELGMLVEAFYPLGSGKLLGREDVRSIAEKYGRSAAQILLRFTIQSGAIPLVKSVHSERQIENIKAFDFELDKEDMELLRQVPHLTAFSGWVAEEAPADAIVDAQKAAQIK